MALGNVNVPGAAYLELKNSLDAEQNDRGKPGGVATLDTTGKVPETQLPSLCPFAAGTSAPADTKKLWIDTTPVTGGLKYWNGSAWVHVPMSAVNPDVVPGTTGPRVVTESELANLETRVTAWSARSMTDQSGSDCKSGCTGTCYTGCATGCSGCGSGCPNSCSGCGSGCPSSCTGCGSGCPSGCSSCGGSCSTGCGDGCDGCSGCGGSCSTGCGSDCDGCSGCGGACSSGCGTSCNKACSQSCTTTCVELCGTSSMTDTTYCTGGSCTAFCTSAARL